MSVALHRLNRPARGNGAVGEALTPSERSIMIGAAEEKLADLFDVLRIDHRNDGNTRETPRRVARMMVDEILSGRFTEPPELTDFENIVNFDQMIVTGPIEIRSTCAHHLMPIFGDAYIGVLPAANGRIIGLSKYDRIVHHFASRLQIQEELVQQIGEFIMERTTPCGLAVRISAVHMCKTHRGVCASHRSRMVTNAWFGKFAEQESLRQEFLQECLGLQGKS